MAALRITELNRLYKARHGDPLPNTDHSRELTEIVAHHMIALGNPLERMAEWTALHAPWITSAELTAMLQYAVVHPRRWKADALAWRLKLSYADRQSLKITTIGAINVNQKQRAALRRKQQKNLMRRRRNQLTELRNHPLTP